MSTSDCGFDVAAWTTSSTSGSRSPRAALTLPRTVCHFLLCGARRGSRTSQSSCAALAAALVRASQGCCPRWACCFLQPPAAAPPLPSVGLPRLPGAVPAIRKRLSRASRASDSPNFFTKLRTAPQATGPNPASQNFAKTSFKFKLRAAMHWPMYCMANSSPWTHGALVSETKVLLLRRPA